MVPAVICGRVDRCIRPSRAVHSEECIAGVVWDGIFFLGCNGMGLSLCLHCVYVCLVNWVCGPELNHCPCSNGLE